MGATAVKIEAILEADSFILQQLSQCGVVEEGDNAKFQQADQENSHDLVFGQRAPGDIASAARRTKRKIILLKFSRMTPPRLIQVPWRI